MMKLLIIKSFHDIIFRYICLMEEKVFSIVEKVSELYQHYGIKSVTMDDVARHLCISKKTLYEYFTDKEDLVKNVVSVNHEKVDGLFSEVVKKNRNAIEELLEVYNLIHNMYRDYNPSMEYDIRKYYPDLSNRIKKDRRKRLLETIYRNLTKGKKEGFYRKELNTKIVAKLHVLRIENMLENELFTVEEITSFKVFHEIFLYHVYGILSPKGAKFFHRNFSKIKSGLG
jgi:TetR/AcrR family transcriptional regulator, cholesterol catabolism regulator